MSILPTWPIAIGTLLVGLLAGAYADHTVMSARIDKMKADTAEVDRQRAEIRAADERAERAKEQTWSARVAKVEQEKANAQEQTRAAGAAALNSERMRQRTERRPATGGAERQAAPACAGSTGAELSRPDASFLIGEATRADTQRDALNACYQAYEAVSK